MVLMITAMIVVMILEINFPDENGMVTSRNSVAWSLGSGKPQNNLWRIWI